MTYLDPEIISDEGAVAEAILASIADQIPGWEPSEGHVETALAEALAIVCATVAALVKDEGRDVYSGFAEAILGISRQAEGVATALSDWAMVDDTGYLIPDGTQVFMRAADGSLVGFATVGDVTVAAGDTSAPGVPVSALEAGPAANGLTGVAAATDPVLGVGSVLLTTVSSGGADAESLADFLTRAVDRARRLRAVPITVEDFAAMALDHESVSRCMAVNLLDPTDPPGSGDDPDEGGHLTVFPIDEAGQAISAGAADEVEALLNGEERPLNITVHVWAPSYKTINVAITVRLTEGAEESAMQDAVEAAITAYLSPATWALDEEAAGRWLPPRTISERTIRSFDVAHVAALVPGVVSVSVCTVNGASSVFMPGWAPLPTPGTVVASVAP
jgi:uncharacterized phage protein gp47/JayE